jgi:ComF family protein
VFSYGGPAEVLINKFKFQGMQQLADLFASCFLLQIENAGLKWPDFLVPIPHAPWHSLLRGYHPSELLARALAKKMKIPFVRALKRSFMSIPQRYKTKEQRKFLSYQPYRLRKGIDLTDRNILLIDDLSTTGATLACCADALKEAFPLQISACTLAIVD